MPVKEGLAGPELGGPCPAILCLDPAGSPLPSSRLCPVHPERMCMCRGLDWPGEGRSTPFPASQ